MCTLMTFFKVVTFNWEGFLTVAARDAPSGRGLALTGTRDVSNFVDQWAVGGNNMVTLYQTHNKQISIVGHVRFVFSRPWIKVEDPEL